MNKKKLLAIILLSLVIFLISCKPYFSKSDKEKIAYTVKKYVKSLEAGDYEQAFSLLTFSHLPQEKNFNLFKMAQEMMSKQYTDIRYEVNDIKISGNFAQADIDTILVAERPVPRKMKVSGQFFFVRPDKKSVWLMVPGNEQSRKRFFDLFKEKIDGKLKFKEEATYWDINGKWISQEELKFEDGKIFYKRDGEWVEK